MVPWKSHVRFEAARASVADNLTEYRRNRLDFEFGDEIIVRLKELQSQGLAGKRLINELITDDWGPPPKFIEITGATSQAVTWLSRGGSRGECLNSRLTR